MQERRGDRSQIRPPRSGGDPADAGRGEQRIGMDWSKIKRDLLLALSSHFFYKFIGLFVLMILTRYLSKEDMGTFFFAGTLCGFCALLTQLGTTNHLTRESAADPERASTHLSQVISLRVPLFAAYLLLLNGFALSFQSDIALIILLTSIYTLFEELYRTYGALFLGLKRVSYNVVSGVAARGLLVLLIVGVVQLERGLNSVVVCYILSNTILVLIAHALVVSRIGRPVWLLNFDSARAVLQKSLPFFVLSVLGLVQFRVDALMLGFMKSYSAVATYETAYRLFEASRFLTLPISMIFYPILCEMAARRQWRPIRRLFGRMVSAAGAAGVMLALGIALLAGILIPLVFGPKYDESITVLRILYLSVPVLYVSTVGRTTVNALHLERKAIRIMIFCVLINVGLNSVAIPIWSAKGAAVTTVITEIILCVWITALLAREFRIRRAAAPSANVTGGLDHAV
jgi:O-antigen/teichoic acid export membrane protein